MFLCFIFFSSGHLTSPFYILKLYPRWYDPLKANQWNFCLLYISEHWCLHHYYENHICQGNYLFKVHHSLAKQAFTYGEITWTLEQYLTRGAVQPDAAAVYAVKLHLFIVQIVDDRWLIRVWYGTWLWEGTFGTWQHTILICW